MVLICGVMWALCFESWGYFQFFQTTFPVIIVRLEMFSGSHRNNLSVSMIPAAREQLHLRGAPG